MPQKVTENQYLERELWVVKSNALIQKSRYQMTLQQSRLMLYLISKIDSVFDTDFREFTISLLDLCSVCGIEKGGNSYKLIKESLQGLADKSVWLPTEDGGEELCRWLDKAKIERTGYITLRISESMKPFLLQLKSDFTKYRLVHALAFKSRYSVQLYELCKSIVYNGVGYAREYSISDFQKHFITPYKAIYDFKRRVIEPALTDINEFSDIQAFCEFTGRGRETRVSLTVILKDSDGIIQARRRTDEALGTISGQLSVFAEVDELIKAERAAGHSLQGQWTWNGEKTD